LNTESVYTVSGYNESVYSESGFTTGQQNWLYMLLYAGQNIFKVALTICQKYGIFEMETKKGGSI